MKTKRGRPPKAAGEKMAYYDFVRLTEAQSEKVSQLAKRLGGLSRAAVYRYLLEKEGG